MAIKQIMVTILHLLFLTWFYNGIYIYIYAFSRPFYPKRLTSFIPFIQVTVSTFYQIYLNNSVILSEACLYLTELFCTFKRLYTA